MAMPYHALQHRALAKLPIAEQALLQAFIEAFPMGVGESRSFSTQVTGLYEDVTALAEEVERAPERYQEAVQQAITRQRDVAEKFGLVEMRDEGLADDPAVVIGYAAAAADHYRQAALEVAEEELTTSFRELKPFLDQVPDERIREDVGALIADPRAAAASYLLAALATRGPELDTKVLLTEIDSALGGDPLYHAARLDAVEECIAYGRPSPALAAAEPSLSAL